MSEETRLENYIEYVDYHEEIKLLVVSFKPIIQIGSDFIFKNNMDINSENEYILNISLNDTKKSDGTYFVLDDVPVAINQINFGCTNVLVNLIDRNFYVKFVSDTLKYINFSQIGSSNVSIDSSRTFDIVHQQTEFFVIMISSLYLLDGEMSENKIIPKKMDEMFHIHNDNIYLNIESGIITKGSFVSYNAIPINCVATEGIIVESFDFDTNLIVSGEFPKEILNHLPLKDKVFHVVTTTSQGNYSFVDEVNIHVRSINKAPLPFGIANN